MNCPKCGAIINLGENFCKECGTKVISENRMETFYFEDSSFQNNQTIMTNQDNHNQDILIDAYIGKNIDKIKNGCSLYLNTLNQYCSVSS
mgnify:CR=1 FL=1